MRSIVSAGHGRACAQRSTAERVRGPGRLVQTASSTANLDSPRTVGRSHGRSCKPPRRLSPAPLCLHTGGRREMGASPPRTTIQSSLSMSDPAAAGQSPFSPLNRFCSFGHRESIGSATVKFPDFRRGRRRQFRDFDFLANEGDHASISLLAWDSSGDGENFLVVNGEHSFSISFAVKPAAYVS